LNPQPYLPGMLVTPILGQTKNEVFSHHPAAAFEIKDFSFGVENPTTIGSATGGAGAGKIKFNEFQIKKTTDRASPIFFNYVCAGAHGSKVKVGMRKAGGDPSSAGKPYLSYKVATVFTTRIDWSGPGDEGPEESVTFVYGKFGVKYNSQKNDGSSPNSGWDSKPQPADLASTACMWCVP
jgi:type VI protein secretion system component Hcp